MFALALPNVTEIVSVLAEDVFSVDVPYATNAALSVPQPISLAVAAPNIPDDENRCDALETFETNNSITKLRLFPLVAMLPD